MLWLGGRVSVGSGIYHTYVFFLFYTCVALVLSTAYLSCMGLFCLYVLANSRQWFILLSMYCDQL